MPKNGNEQNYCISWSWEDTERLGRDIKASADWCWSYAHHALGMVIYFAGTHILHLKIPKKKRALRFFLFLSLCVFMCMFEIVFDSVFSRWGKDMPWFAVTAYLLAVTGFVGDFLGEYAPKFAEQYLGKQDSKKQ